MLLYCDTDPCEVEADALVLPAYSNNEPLHPAVQAVGIKAWGVDWPSKVKGITSKSRFTVGDVDFIWFDKTHKWAYSLVAAAKYSSAWVGGTHSLQQVLHNLEESASNLKLTSMVMHPLVHDGVSFTRLEEMLVEDASALWKDMDLVVFPEWKPPAAPPAAAAGLTLVRTEPAVSVQVQCHDCNSWLLKEDAFRITDHWYCKTCAELLIRPSDYWRQ